MKHHITNQLQLRAAFWQAWISLHGPTKGISKPQNEQPADIRCAWIDFVDSMARDKAISESLARRATL